ncbi:MAG: hypothetical protein U5S82_14050 [Gammaproteobacteria bacterium]|nr:hypothetical protein [Gammaproteobacteria bacterium]
MDRVKAHGAHGFELRGGITVARTRKRPAGRPGARDSMDMRGVRTADHSTAPAKRSIMARLRRRLARFTAPSDMVFSSEMSLEIDRLLIALADCQKRLAKLERRQ